MGITLSRGQRNVEVLVNLNSPTEGERERERDDKINLTSTQKLLIET